MAKNKTASSPNARVNKRIRERDKVTMSKIVDLADNVARPPSKAATSARHPARARAPTPSGTRNAASCRWATRRSTRELFNLNQAKQFMQTMLHGNSINELIDAEKIAQPPRHVLQGPAHRRRARRKRPSPTRTNPTRILEDLEVSLGSLREELHIFAKNRGAMVGNITVVDNGDEIDCRRMGSGGYAIPSITEPDVIQFKKMRRQVRPARRKRHGLEPLQRRPLLGEAQLHPHPRRRPAPARRAPAAPALAARKLKLADHLPARLRSVGALHLQRHQAGLDQPRLRIASAWPSPTPSSSACAQGLRSTAS